MICYIWPSVSCVQVYLHLGWVLISYYHCRDSKCFKNCLDTNGALSFSIRKPKVLLQTLLYLYNYILFCRQAQCLSRTIRQFWVPRRLRKTHLPQPSLHLHPRDPSPKRVETNHATPANQDSARLRLHLVTWTVTRPSTYQQRISSVTRPQLPSDRLQIFRPSSPTATGCFGQDSPVTSTQHIIIRQSFTAQSSHLVYKTVRGAKASAVIYVVSTFRL